ncbi:MAG: hypothetical protein R3A50_16815 [Saprospiraceae bacterium]
MTMNKNFLMLWTFASIMHVQVLSAACLNATESTLYFPRNNGTLILAGENAANNGFRAKSIQHSFSGRSLKANQQHRLLNKLAKNYFKKRWLKDQKKGGFHGSRFLSWFGIAGLILGIAGVTSLLIIVGSFEFGILLPLIPGVLGFVLSAIAFGKIRNPTEFPVKGWMKAVVWSGLILNSLVIGFYVFLGLLLLAWGRR